MSDQLTLSPSTPQHVHLALAQRSTCGQEISSVYNRMRLEYTNTMYLRGMEQSIASFVAFLVALPRHLTWSSFREEMFVWDHGLKGSSASCREGLVMGATHMVERVCCVFLTPKQSSELRIWDQKWGWGHPDGNYILPISRYHILKTPQPFKTVPLAWNHMFK